nr:MgtC/SapB family protein [Fictibacillus sp. 7GRE50]
MVDTEVLVKLGTAIVLGMLLGIEREIRKKPVGLRTCMVISIVSCLLTIISIESAYVFPKSEHVKMDPMRLTAQIISGIGFLGTGVILRRNNDVISGLTTASIIWGAAGTGIAVGSGFLLEALICVFLILFSVEVMPAIIRYIGPKCLREKEIHMTIMIDKSIQISELLVAVREKDIMIKKIKIKDLVDEKNEIDLHVMVADSRLTADVYNEVKKIAAIKSLEIENVA